MCNNPFDITEAIPRKVMTLFYLVDTSGSMSGAKIASLNAAVRQTLPMIGEISANNADAKIKIAVLDFSSDWQWMYPEPQESENFQWIDLQAGGLTSMGAAFEELANKLSQSHGFMGNASGTFAPVLLLFSDGHPTDDVDHGLQQLKKNNWFKAAIKVAIAIGNDANTQTLIDFTGNQEAVLTVHSIDELKKIIHTVSVTASRVASKTASVGQDSADKASEMVGSIQEAIANDPPLAGIDVGTAAQSSGKTDDWSGWQ